MVNALNALHHVKLVRSQQLIAKLVFLDTIYQDQLAYQFVRAVTCSIIMFALSVQIQIV